ncbi:hypothetical protein [Anaerophaga thermohalophila]|uniref:hypothetical protein n=1 Tax=Anaerophaga thermohalophila TaxID=177400 RepID=UPI0002F1168B|nr:hypothetical protein [Anaerophaga thermohalophila]
MLVDEIQVVAANPGGEDALNRLISLLIIAAAVFLTNALTASLGTLVRERQSFVISDYFDNLIHNKTTRIEYGFFEHPKYQNVFFRALHEASFRPSRIFYGIVGILQNLITLIVMGGYFADGSLVGFYRVTANNAACYHYQTKICAGIIQV